MHLLVADIGNTDIKFGLFKDSLLLRHWRIANAWRVIPPTPETICASLRENLQGQEPEVTFDALAYCSVVPDIDPLLRQAVHLNFDVPLHALFAVQPGRSHLPVNFQQYASGQLGLDRLVNACGAQALHPDQPVIIFDFGTATTVDLVDAEAVYQGGAIAPGFSLFCDSLSEKTATLPRVSMVDKDPETLQLGLNTQACMEAGLGLGYRGLLKELLDAAQQRFPSPDCQLLATGGLAEPVLTLCGLSHCFHSIDPALTLSGLAHIYHLNHNDPPVI
jgi:type III pantothenate kinase